jgi:hypothetical protein
VRAEDLVQSELLSARGPVAWSATSEGDAGWALATLAAGCRRRRALLVLRGRRGVDLVLLARELCGEDGVPFALFATQVGATGMLCPPLAALTSRSPPVEGFPPAGPWPRRSSIKGPLSL